ncbi:MAG TPA: hypothetical protein VJH37_00105 [Candidatus Nanoarchaeia archaeon]|nr:hypothetical protein [Candidatus Nanoarchaeia archaeon]
MSWKQFEKWLNESEEWLDKRIVRDKKKYGKFAPNYTEWIIQHYIGFKTFKETRRLVIATWALALATILLVLFTARKLAIVPEKYYFSWTCRAKPVNLDSHS